MSKKRGCLKLLLLLVLAGALLTWLVGECFFNLNSNLVAVSVRDSKQTLHILSKRGTWKPATGLTTADLDAALIERHQETGMRWATLKVRREGGLAADVAQRVFGAEVHVVTLSPERFDFLTTFQPKFALTTASERMAEENLWFSITGNFRDPKGRPMGWVYHEGRQVNVPFGEWSGCFFVKDGRPWFGPKSLLNEVPGLIQEGSQVYPSVMKNHTIFSYVELQPDEFFDGTKISYRALGGMRKDGTIVFVLSGDGGVMNVSEVTEIARKLDVQHATLLDGGRALQYSIRTDDGPWHFTAFNTLLPFTHKFLERQRSPVFIGARRKAPVIVGGGSE
ncbi:phosphodiester glycosidase family protein [Prosthecobacter sp.]|uniref:phosphodiester glycosidase family protein n=1 Tax=Prosthecobacter sp. TaxID=1965333 RepID=UPI002ABBC2F0|nr:phosphodiester glycosidase family protein [Prosthecobacter sp.]MDZ4404947.1 phosphodiester glycosidase family protein [Prosthecobacter sp.]